MTLRGQPCRTPNPATPTGAGPRAGGLVPRGVCGPVHQGRLLVRRCRAQRPYASPGHPNRSSTCARSPHILDFRLLPSQLTTFFHKTLSTATRRLGKQQTIGYSIGGSPPVPWRPGQEEHPPEKHLT